MTRLDLISIRDMEELLTWIKGFICLPHSQLGRSGSVCPFVLPSIEKNAFSVAFHYEIDGSDADKIKHIIASYADMFLKLSLETNRESDRELLTFLVIFPNIPQERSSIIDAVHAEMKTYFVQKGLMLGQFHPNCVEPAIHNPSFHVNIAPFSLLAIRNMAFRDLQFLAEKEQWFAEYYLRFNSRYELNQVPKRGGLVELFNDARERFPLVVRGFKETR